MEALHELPDPRKKGRLLNQSIRLMWVSLDIAIQRLHEAGEDNMARFLQANLDLALRATEVANIGETQ